MSDFYRKNTQHVDASGIEAVESSDEPMGYTENASLLRPQAPRGTVFNRKMVTVLMVVLGVVVGIGIMYAFTPKSENTPTQTTGAETMKEEPLTAEAPTPPATPNIIDSLPSTYQDKLPEYNPQSFPPLPNNMASDGENGPLSWPIAQFNSVKGMITGNQGEYSQTQSPEQKELEKVRTSQIRFGNGLGNNVTKNEVKPGTDVGVQPNQSKPQTENTRNSQDPQLEYLQKSRSSAFYSKSQLSAPISKYEIKAGTIIPAVLITGINSDLPGSIIAQVRENVYDSVTGQYLLLPQGTRLIGEYNSQILYAQERVLIVWNRLILPNGYSLDLESLQGVDGSGYAGLKDKVNHHYGRLAGGILLSSMLAAGTYEVGRNSNNTTVYIATSEAAENINNFGEKVAEKNLNIQPSITIRPGFTFNVLVNKDFVLSPYQN